MATIVKGDLYESIDGKLHEIKRQIRQKGGYPYDPARLDIALQAIVEGVFETSSRQLAGKIELPALSTTYNQSLGLRALIELAVGERNRGNIDFGITQDRFPLSGTGIRKVHLRVEAYLDNETSEQAASRLVAAGHTLANTGDLAGFLHDHPKEVEKWTWVFAISENSRWTLPGGGVLVPYATVDGAGRLFRLYYFRYQLRSRSGVLVASEPASLPVGRQVGARTLGPLALAAK